MSMRADLSRAARELRSVRAPSDARRLIGRVKRAHSRLLMERIPVRLLVPLVYNIMLQRDPDPAGLADHVDRLGSGDLDALGLVESIRASEEYMRRVPLRDPLVALHHSRCEFVRSLPQAGRILDLGGTSQSEVDGALVHLGYPYRFEALTIRDLEHEERHEIYRHSERVAEVDSPSGPVTYSYGSMADLSDFDDHSFDLVYSGQSIEHVDEADGDRTLAEVWRVLAPSGHFALDTPNGPVCRLHSPEMINPDHEIEYSHAQMSAKLVSAGFEILEAKGLNYLGGPAATTTFDFGRIAANVGLFSAMEDCYLLAYVTQKPG